MKKFVAAGGRNSRKFESIGKIGIKITDRYPSIEGYLLKGLCLNEVCRLF
jgi:hypothetical protein